MKETVSIPTPGVGGPARCEEAAKRCTALNWTVGPTLNKGETCARFD